MGWLPCPLPYGHDKGAFMSRACSTCAIIASAKAFSVLDIFFKKLKRKLNGCT